ncbi:MAG: 2-C-methyl-D-erythritol 2,4-cyclodiphosphate synthase [Bacillota bacterium]|nr:2-C-methyl-D-erythritol 2,4-cyclodiphosphate synthase [Bacillota bacterium]
MKVSVIIAAGGVGKRFGASTPKQYMKIDGVTVLEKALSAFSRFDQVIVAGVDTPPGPQRQDTVAAALEKVTGDVVLIHDAARPFISEDVINRVVQKLEQGSRAVIPCVRPKNTIRTASETLNRDELYEVQTPQGFDAQLLKDAYKKAAEENFYGTDDASVVEHSCHCEGEARSNLIDIVEGDYANIKITTKDDMPKSVRFGNGYDVHRLVENRKLMLGCTHIPYEKGLLGHSDADVLSHAMADALLGAASLGDIGRIFPDSGPGSEATEGMAGSEILSTVAKMVREKGYEIMMIDGTVIAEKPKLMPHIETMRAGIAKALDINIDQVSVKATTEENMSDVSRNGMAAIATCTLKG